MDTASQRIAGVEVRISGQGERTIVMAHGWPDTLRLWEPTAQALGDGFRCVRFTLPGFDGTRPLKAHPVDEVVAVYREVIEATSPGRPVILMVHDWGTVFGYQYAMRHPDRVSHLIGLDVGDANSPEHLRSMGLKAKAMVAAYQGWLVLAWRIGGRLGQGMTKLAARVLHAPDPVHADLGMNYPYDIAWTGSHGGMGSVRRLQPPCPMLFVYGRRKPFMFHSPAWAGSLAQRPGCAVVALDSGHWVMRHRDFVPAVRRWLGP